MRSHPDGFSLIEVFVAIAIVATLMVIGFSAVDRVREGRLNAECVSRLRSTSAAVHMMVVENNGIFQSWVRGNSVTGAYIWGDILVQRRYLRKETLRCPAAASLRSLDNSGWYWNTYAFNMIDESGIPLRPQGAGQVYQLRFFSVASPSRHIMLADSATLAFITPGVRSDTFRVNIQSSTDGVQLRHFGRVNVAFMDGHVESLGRTDAMKYFPEDVIYEKNQ